MTLRGDRIVDIRGFDGRAAAAARAGVRAWAEVGTNPGLLTEFHPSSPSASLASVVHAAPNMAIRMPWLAAFGVAPLSAGWLFVPVPGSQ